MPTPTDQLPTEVRDALKRGNLVEAIKLLRNATGLGLAEAKSLIDGQAKESAAPSMSVASALILPEVAAAIKSRNKIAAVRLLRQHTGIGMKDAKDAIDAATEMTPGAAPGDLAPGEVPRSGGAGRWLAILAIVALIAYFFLMRGAG